MGQLIASDRLTSKDLKVEYIPCGTAPATHDENFVFNAVDGGTFQIQVNGERTADITYDETTQGNTATAIQTAVDGLPNLETGDLTVTGSASDGGTEDDTFNFLGAADGWYRITIFDTGLTNSASSEEPEIVRDTVTQGTQVFDLTGEMSSFSFNVTADKTDFTSLNEFDATEKTVKRSMTFEFMTYDANQDFADFVLEVSQVGKMIVYKEGKVAGRKFFSFQAEIDDLSEDFPDHDQLEISVSGSRQGSDIDPRWSIYRP